VSYTRKLNTHLIVKQLSYFI